MIYFDTNIRKGCSKADFDSICSVPINIHIYQQFIYNNNMIQAYKLVLYP